MKKFSFSLFLILYCSIVAIAATISNTPLVPSPLQATDRLPLGRPGSGTAYTASIGQIDDYIQSQFSSALNTFGEIPSAYIETSTSTGTTSATLEDVPDMSVNITLTEGAHIAVFASFQISTISGAAASTLAVAFNIDGSDHAETQRYLSGTSDTGIGSIIHRTTIPLTAGVHTIKLRYRRVSGTATPGINRADMIVVSLQGQGGSGGAVGIPAQDCGAGKAFQSYSGGVFGCYSVASATQDISGKLDTEVFNAYTSSRTSSIQSFSGSSAPDQTLANGTNINVSSNVETGVHTIGIIGQIADENIASAAAWNAKQAALTGVGSFELGSGLSGDRSSLIDFHSDDTNTDYSMRLYRAAGVNGNAYLNVLGTGTTLLYNNGVNSFQTNQYGPRYNLTKSSYSAVETESDGLWGKLTFTGTGTAWSDYVGSAAHFRSVFNNATGLGTMHGLSTHMYVQASGNDMNEATPLYSELMSDDGGRLWGTDQHTHGPVANQADVLMGSSIITNNYNATTPYRGSYGTVLTTKPIGVPSGRATATTYPVGAALAIVGRSGVFNNATSVGFNTAIQLGGRAGGWMDIGDYSKMGKGIETIGDFSGAALDTSAATFTTGNIAIKLSGTQKISDGTNSYTVAELAAGGGGGSGDMLAATWDTDSNGAIDVAKGGTNGTTAATGATGLGLGTTDSVTHLRLSTSGTTSSIPFNVSNTVTSTFGALVTPTIDAAANGATALLYRPQIKPAASGSSFQSNYFSVQVGGTSQASPNTNNITTLTDLHNRIDLLNSYTGTITNAQTISVLDASITSGTSGAGSITNLIGLNVADLTKGTATNVGIQSVVSAGTGKYNLYLPGTAVNYINGNTQIGSATATAGAEKLQVTGNASVSGYVLAGSVKSDGRWDEKQATSTATTYAPDLSTGSQFILTPTGDLTINQPTNAPASGYGTSILFGIDPGGHTITFNSTYYKWLTTTPTLPTTSGKRFFVSCSTIDQGTTYDCVYVGVRQ